jgi:transposase
MQFIGIDVSKKRLHSTWLRDPQQGLIKTKASDNSPEGHTLLLAWAQRVSGAAPGELCFVLEATGVYHEAVALFLHQAGYQVAVTNPLHIKRFAESHGIRTKNDHHDGRVLALYGHERRPQAWQPPPAHVRDLRALLRRLEALEEDLQREANRLEKAQIEGAPERVIASLQSMRVALSEEIEQLRREIDDHIGAHPDLKAQRAHLETIPGVGPKLSAWFLALFRLKAFHDAKQAAAFLGLVPVEYQSGTSVLSSKRETKWILSPLRTCSGTSSYSPRLSSGRRISLMPARRAAISFSRTPPMGKTSPVRVISPVMAMRRTGSLRASESRAEAMVMPAEGPSLGVAPAGTWRWMKALSKKAGSAPNSSRGWT